MAKRMQLGDVRIELVRKPIRNLHLSVYPPTGRVRIAAPERATDESIRLFAIAKLGWIKRQQSKLRTQERESRREYIERESHYVWGQRYLLHVIERDAPPTIELTPRRLVLGYPSRCLAGTSQAADGSMVSAAIEGGRAATR